MKAIILGATGLVGAKLLQQLVDESRFTEIIAVTRRDVAYQFSKVCNEVIDFNAFKLRGQYPLPSNY